MATAKNQNDATKPVKIALNLIKADHALQPRVEMDDEHWNRMARAYVEGEDIPPPIHLFFDGKFYWLVDGFHRYKAMWSLRHMGAKFTHIKAFVHNGAKGDAIAFAAQANLNNRSKPMSDADRKKAMHMLMDLPEWRGKSSHHLGILFGVSNSISKRYWVEYFSARGLPVPLTVRDTKGAIQPTTRRTKTNLKTPAITKLKNGNLRARIDGKAIALGRNDEDASAALASAMDKAETGKRKYESSSSIVEILSGHCIHSENVYGFRRLGSFGLYGRSVGGLAITWESFRGSDGATFAYARACHARFVSGATRAVVLCPVEDGPAELIEDFRKMGVEWMTIEDFVASLEGADPSDSA